MTAGLPAWWVTAALAMVVMAAVLGSIMVARRRARRLTDPVQGTLLVTGGNGPAPHSVYSRYQVYGVVTAAGLPATAVERRGYARNAKWPFPGKKLPVLVDRADPTRLKILWDRVPTGERVAAEQADRLAQAMRGQGTPAPASPDLAPPSGSAADAIAAALRDSLAKAGLQPDQLNVRATMSTAGMVGEAATAVVTATRDVPTPPGQPRPPGGAVELTLDVTRADGTRYAASAGAMFSSTERRARFGVVGARLPVRINPADPTRVAIDHTALDLSGPA